MSTGQDIQPNSLEGAYLERMFRAKLPRDLRDKLEFVHLVQVNNKHDAFQVRFSTGQQAVIPAHKMTDDATIARLCVQIR